MAGFHQTIVLGNVGRDAELRYTQSDTAVADFSVAVTETWNSDGERQERVTWYKVTAWKALAEIVGKYVKKGMQVHVVGTISASAYLDRNGDPKSSLELTARDIQFLGNRGDTSGNGAGQERKHEIDPADIPF